MVKIIHILNHTPPPITYKLSPDEYSKYGEAEFINIGENKWVGFFNDFHHISAREILKRDNSFIHECWRPYGSFIKKPYEGYLKGIKHRVFPSSHIKIKKIFALEYSLIMFKELKKEIKNNNVILHIHDGHSNFITWLLLKLYRSNVPIIYQHRGGWFSIFEYGYSSNPLKQLNYFFQKKALKSLYFYFSGSQVEFAFLKNALKMSNCDFLMDGVDFSVFKPSVNKTSVRKKLELPLNICLLLHVGRYNTTKGLDKLILAYEGIKRERDDIALILVGGYKSDELFSAACNSGAIIRESISENELLEYYQASDIYLMLVTNKLIEKFGGFGLAPIQALACGLPVMSPNLIHYPGSIEEREKIGITLDINMDGVADKIIEMITIIKQYNECREFAKKYFDINDSVHKILDKYFSAARDYNYKF
jgi:glycosyltransferase involved in cell wall biosynthesis